MKKQVVSAGKLRRDVVMKFQEKVGSNNCSVSSPGAAWLPGILHRMPASHTLAAEAVRRAGKPVAETGLHLPIVHDASWSTWIPPPRGMTTHYIL